MTKEDERPIYIRIADELRARIMSGELREGDRLPSIPELRRTHGAADHTARQALNVLVTEGLAVSKPGAGTFVRSRPAPRRLVRSFTLRLDSPGSPFAADMQRQGHRATWSYESRTTIAPPAIRERLALDEPADVEDVVRTDYVFTANGEPSELSTSWEPLAITRGTPVVLPEDGPHRGVVDRMHSIGVMVDGCTETVRGRLGTAEECTALRVPAGSMMLTIERTYYAQGRPVETADIVLAAERYELLYGEPVRPR